MKPQKITTKKLRPTLLALSASIAMGLSGTAAASTTAQDVKLFGAQKLESGYKLAGRSAEQEEMAKAKEGKCGAGKCGGAEKKAAEGKCGAGKCGGAAKKAADGKCGAGKCGGDKMKGKEGKCGGAKCEEKVKALEVEFNAKLKALEEKMQK